MRDKKTERRSGDCPDSKENEIFNHDDSFQIR
jgi:hypothetical protein